MASKNRFMIRKILFGLLILISAFIGLIYFWLNSLKPDYTGELELSGIKSETRIYYDKIGVPHIYAESANDAYFALGFVLAQDRLFQLELIRRLAGGRLAEVLGKDLVSSDKFFKTLGIHRHASWSAKEFKATAPKEVQAATEAYIAGVNTFINQGDKPIEFTLLGIEAGPFTLEDVFLVTGYMSFGFAEGFKIDPMVEDMYRSLNIEFIKIIDQNWSAAGEKIPLNRNNDFKASVFSSEIEKILSVMPVSPWIGSNAWVIAPKKSKSGKTLLCNDTHMGFTQPAVWYEAHISYPGFSMYGNHLAGFPFALTAHTPVAANGLTMFENDDVDFYIEQIENNQVVYKGSKADLKKHEETILVKGGEKISFTVLETPHGPLVNDAFEPLAGSKEKISVWWTYLKFPAKSIEAVFALNHAKSMDEARAAASLIHAPGLNVMYGDSAGNIAWWAAARLFKRPAHVNPLRFLDGASGNDEPLEWLDFSENPYSENPESGYVYSANNQPDSIRIGFYPGYYVPENRALKITRKLNENSTFGPEDMKLLMLNNQSDEDADLARNLLNTLGSIEPNAIKTEEANRLSSWDGVYGMESHGALIFNHWVYNILREIMVNKIGVSLFNRYMNTHFMKVSYPHLIRRIETEWWDNWVTREKEKRAQVIKKTWHKTIAELKGIYGKESAKWKWSRAHTVEHAHPLGRKKPLNLFFNIGPQPIAGGNEVLLNTGFRLDSTATYPVFFGPSMRRIIDFSDTDHSWSILPTGQSGYFMADHYSDQAEMYNSGIFRYQLMNKSEIENQSKGFLLLKPSK